MFVERPLNGTPEPGPTDVNDDHFETTTDPTAAKSFLKEHKTAKIVFIIDTHSLDNGYFLYAGDTPNTYDGCQLIEASIPCNPANSYLNSSHRSSMTARQRASSIISLMGMQPQPIHTRASS